MKKTFLTAMAAIALLIGGSAAVFADNPCNSACQAREGFETIGEGTKEAAVNSYNVVKEGTVKAYNKAANGVEVGYEKTKKGVVKGYNVVKDGTVNTYEKAKEGTVNLWNKAKAKIHEATE